MTLNSAAESLNVWGNHFFRFVWPVLWQSSLLIIAMFLLDLVARRKLRPAVRYALWLVVLMKLLLPPSLAFPTSLGWWLRPREVVSAKPPNSVYVVTYGPTRGTIPLPDRSRRVLPQPQIKVSAGGWAVAATSGVALTLLSVMLFRWRRLHGELRQARPTPIWLSELLSSTQRQARYRRPVGIALANASISPALWGLFRPVIVLPAALVERLTPEQLRAVLLHELVHLRNGDVWINCFQSLLQIAYWWHPLLWLANAYIRRVREEAVDDAVRLALGEEAETYPPTLLEVARLALARPLATLGLVGILESRYALRQRVERLINFPAPRRAGLSIVSVLVIFAFASVALPMGRAPARIVNSGDSSLNSGAGITEKEKAIKPPPSGVSIQSSTEDGSLESEVPAGITTARNGAVLTYGDTRLSADTITLNHETGGVVAEGSVSLKTVGADLPMGGTLSMSLTNLQLAQIQPSAIRPSASGQFGASGRMAILNKLNAIHLDNVVFDNLPLSEVVNYLSTESKKRDPEGKGINFILMPYVGATAPGVIDPATGALIAASQTDIDDINTVSIRLPRPLNDVRMVDVLDAITKVADKRIRYSIEEYGVSFRLAGNEPTPSPLFTRRINVDPGVFAQGLESVVGVSVGNFQTGGQGGGGQQNGSGISVPRVQVAPNSGAGQAGQGGVQGGGGGISGVTRPTTMVSPQAVRQFFVNAGVDLTPPKSVFYNDRSGSLMVHATMEDLDIIEKAVGALGAHLAQPASARLNGASPDPELSRGNQAKAPVLGGSPIAGKGLTKTLEVAAASSPIPSVPTHQINIKAKFLEIAKGDTQYFLSLLNELRAQYPANDAPNALTISGSEQDGSHAEVLTDEQFRVLLRTIEQRDGTDLLSEAAVTTLSGRQAQIQIADMKTIVVKINPQALVLPGVASTNLFVTENLSLGPVLNVVPVVADDGITVSLDVTATVTGFLGYDAPAKGESVRVYVDGKSKSIKPPHPHIRVCHMQPQAATVTDGQTVLIGKPKVVTIAYDQGKAVGEPGTENKELLVFVTTIMIDSSGNPIHSSAAPGQK